MIDTTNEVFSSIEKRDQQLISSMEKLFSAAQADAVFSEPVSSGNYTVITACEVSVAGGFGSGLGFGPEKQAGEAAQAQKSSGGGGVGGGGASNGRPVAAIIVGPDGVTVKPIYDVTKVALAGLAFAGTVVAMLRKVLK